jgi:hypothetical protein
MGDLLDVLVMHLLPFVKKKKKKQKDQIFIFEKVTNKK